jgi:hypothetical protein
MEAKVTAAEERATCAENNLKATKDRYNELLLYIKNREAPNHYPTNNRPNIPLPRPPTRSLPQMVTNAPYSYPSHNLRPHSSHSSPHLRSISNQGSRQVLQKRYIDPMTTPLHQSFSGNDENISSQDYALAYRIPNNSTNKRMCIHSSYEYPDEYHGGGFSQECSSISEGSFEFGTPQDDPFGVYSSDS